ncbi:MAG: guanylate kinase [Candidatus Moraniibacteriota bacterium]|nr:MAG: guanylate kinase [Candidatus Moranbacteria bacterium]
MDIKNIFIISGPSGAGEDSIINELKKRMNVRTIVTTTTRDMRSGESEGKPYYFVSIKKFKNLIKEDGFVEWAQQYNGQYYGVTKQEFADIVAEGKIGLWKIEYKGVQTAKKKFPHIIAILIMAESLDVLEKRIRNRSKVTEEYVQERMKYTKEWLKHTDVYDYHVINRQNKLFEAVEEVENIIKKHIENNEKPC